MAVKAKSRPVVINVIIFAILLLHSVYAFPQSFPKFHTEPISKNILKQTFTYVVKDSISLKLDVYSKDVQPNTKKPCIIFVFGGAFVIGERDDSLYNNYFSSAVEHGYIMISISYRLGLKGVTNVSLFNTAPLKMAVDMAVDDLYDATNWVIANREKLGVDTSKIILSGSSAGAITVQTAEFERCNLRGTSQKLPVDFKYAGVVSFSGAILSYDGWPSYKQPPAPVLMFHGTADKIVPYNKIKFFNKGLFGSSSMAARFKKNNYSYYIYRETDMGHEVAVLPMIESLPVIFNFLDWCVINNKPYQMDMSFKDPAAKPMLTMSARALFEKLASNKPKQTTPAPEVQTN
jgi:predicted esterase